MTTSSMDHAQLAAAVMLLVALTAAGDVVAQVHGSAPSGGHGGFAHASGGVSRVAGPHQHMDTRFAHNRPYYDHGYAMPNMPRNGRPIDRGQNHYRYDRGYWYRRGERGWVVDAAPIGAFVPVLPLFYSTVWYGGNPYYYANDTYYSWQNDQDQYEVVDPPADIETDGIVMPPNDAVSVSANDGQSEEQESRDRAECDVTAGQQTGYADGQMTPDDAASRQADFRRAEASCLESRGYSVD